MLHFCAGSRSTVCIGMAFLLWHALAASTGAGTLVSIFPNGFETGLCAWSIVANPELCDGVDNDCDAAIDEDGVCMVCGDGFIIPGVEECDDAPPAENGDGCSDTCTVEHGFQCVGQPSVCFAICGDAVVATGVEGCDDGNVLNGDGCSDTCNPEHGFQCVGEPSVCAAICGDGLIAPGVEGCDDQNVVSGDGCSAICFIEGGWQCTGEPSVCVPL